MLNAKVGIFINALDSYHDHILRETERAAASAGIEIEVFDAQRSAMKQAQDLVRFQYSNTGKRLCVFVIPEADVVHEGKIEALPTFQQAKRLLEGGIGWIMLNHGHEEFVSFLRKSFPDPPVALMAINNVEFGHIQGRQLLRLLPSGGTVLCVRGNPRDSACLDRTTGMNKELADSGIAIEAIDALWSGDTAAAMVEKWITSPQRRQLPLHAVVAQNDLMALATRKARCSRGLTRPTRVSTTARARRRRSS